MFTKALSDFIVGARYSDLPMEAIEGAKRGVLDFLGVSIAGSREDAVTILSGLVRARKSAPEASIINGDYQADAALAAYVNGTISHALDYDDVIHAPPFWMGHPSVVILPAVIAMAERQNLSGRDLILAYCVGIEVYAKVGLYCGDRPYKNGWHNTSYIGSMAAAGAAAKLLNLDEVQVRRSFGIAASLAGGMRQNFGTMTKPLHAGIGARNGVEAALMAEAGMTADETIFEAPLGFRRVFTLEPIVDDGAIPYGNDRISLEAFSALLGAPWSIASPGMSYKICPSCRATHFGMEAALEFAGQHPGRHHDIAAIDCKVPKHMESVLFYHNPTKGLEGKFSLEYVLARTVLSGVPTIDDFTDDRVNEADVKQMIARIAVTFFEPAAGEFGAPEFRFTLTDGRHFETRVEYPRGEPENPVSNDALATKFEDCAGIYFGDGDLGAIKSAVFGLDTLSSVAELMRLVRAR